MDSPTLLPWIVDYHLRLSVDSPTLLPWIVAYHRPTFCGFANTIALDRRLSSTECLGTRQHYCPACIVDHYRLTISRVAQWPKRIFKKINTSVAQHLWRIKITTTWNALPNEVVSRRTVNSFNNRLDKHWAENSSYVREKLTGSNHRCCAWFKSAQTVLSQRFAENEPTVSPTTYFTVTTSVAPRWCKW